MDDFQDTGLGEFPLPHAPPDGEVRSAGHLTVRVRERPLVAPEQPGPQGINLRADVSDKTDGPTVGKWSQPL